MAAVAEEAFQEEAVVHLEAPVHTEGRAVYLVAPPCDRVDNTSRLCESHQQSWCRIRCGHWTLACQPW